MRKKCLVLILVFFGTFFIGYDYYHKKLNAASIAYHAGGNITARINMAPTGISGPNIGLQKGDKIYIGVDNPKDNTPLGWQLVNYMSGYDYYKTTPGGSTYNFVQDTPISGWYSLSTKDIGKDHSLASWTYPDWITPVNSTRLAGVLDTLNRSLVANPLVTYRNLTIARNGLLASTGHSTEVRLGVNIRDTYNGKIAYLVGFEEKGSLAHENDFKFHGDYHSGDTQSGYGVSGNCEGMISATSGGFTWLPITTDLLIRPSITLDVSNVVFALSLGNRSGFASITEPSLGSYTSLYSATSAYDEMKVRLYNGSLTAQFHQIQNKRGNSITKAAKDAKVNLSLNANPGNDGKGGIYTVSVMIFSDTGQFLYYMPLEDAKGNALYELDLQGLPVGKYKIAVVNEAYNENSTAPADSGYISSLLPLEIVSPLSLSAASQTGLEYQRNVNYGDKVATYTTSHGVAPITATVVSDSGVSGHINDYQLFSISNGDIVVNDPNGLNAGDYYFKVNVIDDNGDPVGGVNSSTIHIVVGKGNPTVAFNISNTTKKSIQGAATAWSETATATPSTGTKITYSITGGDVSLVSIDPDTGAITYTGSNAFGKVKIRATVDDDPSTGNDNYNSAFVEKEIVIYREVDGSVTPHANSSDTTIPTFTASDSNVSTGGIIGTIHGTLGTPDTIGGSITTYHYGLKPGVGNASFFSVDPNTGVIKTTANLGVNSYTITVTVSDNWSTKEIPVTINVGMSAAENLKFYENSTSNTMITTKSVKATDTGVVVYATVKGSTNNNPVTYRIKDGSTNVITVNPTSGAITINGVGTVIIVAEKNGAAGQANASAELTFTVTAGTQNFIYTDNAGNELPKTGNKYNTISEVYAPNKTFQLYTAGNPTGSTVTYQLKAGSPSDVISVSQTGLVSILNASISPSQIGKVIVEATSHDPSGTYADKTIEVPINITKANQTISFAGITYATSGNGTVTPVINEQDISSNAGGVTVNDTDYFITIDNSISTSIAWTNDGVSVEYSYSGNNGLDIPLHVEKPGNRNYNKAETDGMMHIMGPNENTLALNRPGKIIYGDHFTIRSLQDDSSSTNVQYTFVVDNTTYISNPTVTGNKAEFDALKYSGSTNIQIKVTRTADGELPLSKTITVQVLPKPIEIIIDDKAKLKGEQNPALTYQDFKSQLVTWNGVQDAIQANDIKLSTTAKTNSNAGAYPIKGDSNLLNTAYPNYSFTFKEGTLTITEENIEDHWYHLELDDGNKTLYTGGWTNKDVNIISDHNDYINLSLDQSTWRPNQITVTKEGENNQSFWMKKNSGAITKEKQEIIKIDKTAPKVKGIKAKDTNNTLQNIINKLTGGIFFKPGTAFEITTDDSKDNLKVSGTKEIAYKVYKIVDGAEELIKDGTLAVTNEKAKITISETVGKYKVCVIPTDNAGNTNTESCHEVELKKIDVDVDGDGKPDFNDPDGDGCPDLNIKWKDPNTNKWIVINGDRNNDGIPDLNIDSNGDGKPDLNIDTDNDGKPDLNLVILKKSDWKPTKCVKADIDNGILEEYCTGTSVKAVINIDTDNDGIPNINIDNKGDFKPHINISKDGKTPSVNIVEIHEWKPKKDYKSGKFTYDSIGKNDMKPEINIDSDGDGLPDINVDLDDDGEPDINIDIDGDGIPDIDIDSDGDGLPDVNVDTDGDGKPNDNIIEITEWKPNKNADGDFPYDTMDFSNPNDPDDDNDTSVKGQYNPATSMGGASTGDSTNLMLYTRISFLSIGALLFIGYKLKQLVK